MVMRLRLAADADQTSLPEILRFRTGQPEYLVDVFEKASGVPACLPVRVTGTGRREKGKSIESELEIFHDIT